MARKNRLLEKNFENLKVLRTRMFRPPSGPSRRRCLCLCNCGRKFFTWAHQLMDENTTSCGCARATKALTPAPKFGAQPFRQKPRPTKYAQGYSVVGHPLSALYRRWSAMHARCTDPKLRDYPRYGGRGIRVCARWDDFELFVFDMGTPPFDGASIDRRDNNGDYTPRNCRWATPEEQEANK